MKQLLREGGGGHGGHPFPIPISNSLSIPVLLNTSGTPLLSFRRAGGKRGGVISPPAEVFHSVISQMTEASCRNAGEDPAVLGRGSPWCQCHPEPHLRKQV